MPLLGTLKKKSFRPENDQGLLPWDASGDIGRRESDSVFIGRCSNPDCRSGWLQLFRSRTRPVFEEGWVCSAKCTRERLEAAVRREFDGWVPHAAQHRHRVPLGLVMLEQGWITTEQLRRAIIAQRNAGTLRLGEWLVKQGAASEELVARALSLQWGCPVLAPANSMPSPELLPRLFVEAFGAVPLRDASGRVLYLGFEQNVDTALTFSVERMTGRRVDSGVLPSSSYQDLLGRVGGAVFPPSQTAEAVSESAAAHLLAKAIEREQPISSRMVRTHEWLWLRMFVRTHSATTSKRARVKDVICKVGPF